ncbi:MAG TPA: PQQ-binding-like beta-propeller repeat protein [Anaerolineales bacterium]|nr:PQQ-binding-like beta-propeller repeat protein [Anaerolineales bacterium]
MKTLSRIVVFVVSCLVIGSCSLINFPSESQAPHHLPEVNEEYKVVWELSNIRIDNNDRRSMIVSSPGKIVFEGWKDEKSLVLTAIDSLSGDVLWQKPIYSSSGYLISQDKVVYRGTFGDAELQTYDADTGDMLWENKLSGAHSVTELYSTTDKLFIFTGNDKFLILDAEGEILEIRSEPYRTFLENNGRLYRNRNSSFELFDTSTQKVVWDVNIEDRFTHSPVFDNGKIYLRTWAVPTEIYSIDDVTGTVDWKVSYDVVSNLCVLKTRIYFLTLDGNLVAIDRLSGNEVSKVKLSPAFDHTKQIGGYFVAADSLNNVLAISFGDNAQIMGLKITNP